MESNTEIFPSSLILYLFIINFNKTMMSLLERFEIKSGEEISVKNENGTYFVELRKSEKVNLNPNDIYTRDIMPHTGNYIRVDGYTFPTTDFNVSELKETGVIGMINDRIEVSKDQFLEICNITKTK